MLETVLKLLSEQALGSRPAFERPITHLKYGVMGAIIAGLAAAGGILALAAALYFWLTASGLTPAPAFAVVGGAFFVLAVAAWGVCSRLMDRELARQKQQRLEAELQKQQPADLQTLLVDVVAEVGRAFVDGMREPSPPKQTQAAQHDAPAPEPETDSVETPEGSLGMDASDPNSYSLRR